VKLEEVLMRKDSGLLGMMQDSLFTEIEIRKSKLNF
jgi:hypothetical protein